MLKVHSIETFGTHDGPGIRLVVFLQGCNMRCLYCQNADTQDNVGSKTMNSDQIINLLHKEEPYFGSSGGLTISGGEPTLQSAALIELFKKANSNGFHTCLDTNGSIATNEVKKLYDLTDLVLLDVKHINQEWHKKITGLSNISTLSMAEYRESTGKPMWLRYVLVPGFSDQENYIEGWAKHFTNYKTVEKVEILPYHTLGAHKFKLLGRSNPLQGTDTPNSESINKVVNTFKRYFNEVVCQ